MANRSVPPAASPRAGRIGETDPLPGAATPPGNRLEIAAHRLHLVHACLARRTFPSLTQ